ncbi:hypothetical protein Nepgr_028134 [Nepenthes gracilis]|uniref:Uncharacterized protein n=1 Tax=Nepenthes gracilis TaxID=150966 RepID=A0AAD3TBV7_NEPGR|nr:hypothetical protein Nepgr_028134 [Nepenthes gracilis]
MLRYGSYCYITMSPAITLISVSNKDKTDIGVSLVRIDYTSKKTLLVSSKLSGAAECLPKAVPSKMTRGKYECNNSSMVLHPEADDPVAKRSSCCCIRHLTKHVEFCQIIHEMSFRISIIIMNVFPFVIFLN